MLCHSLVVNKELSLKAKSCNYSVSKGARCGGLGICPGHFLGPSQVRCFRHVLLEGSPGANPGHDVEIISLDWIGNALMSFQMSWRCIEHEKVDEWMSNSSKLIYISLKNY